MRLYDQFRAATGGLFDLALMGAITKLDKYFASAQCFQIADDIAIACSEVCHSKPSSLLSAIDLVRLPYQNTWIEWTPTQRLYSRHNGKPVPRKVGMLLMGNERCDQGCAALGWEHEGGSIMLNPLGMLFDWRSDGEPAIAAYVRKYFKEGAENYIARRRQAIMTAPIPERWYKHGSDAKELEAYRRLELRAQIVPLDECTNYLALNGYMPGTPVYESHVEDLAGELPFIEAFLLLLNSRNSIVDQRRDDFAKLNKARQKQHKAPLQEFTTTRLKMSRVQQNRALAAGYTRESARLHLVRGHYKVRASGVYWWSPHNRGKIATQAKRREYAVV